MDPEKAAALFVVYTQIRDKYLEIRKEIKKTPFASVVQDDTKKYFTAKKKKRTSQPSSGGVTKKKSKK
jgi:hypothetical protein